MLQKNIYMFQYIYIYKQIDNRQIGRQIDKIDIIDNIVDDFSIIVLKYGLIYFTSDWG